MGYTLPTEALRTLVATLTGVPTARVYWQGEPERAVGLFGAAGESGKITLTATARATNGTEEMRLDDDGHEFVRADRIMTITARADNFLRMGLAVDTLEGLRLGLFRRSSRKALRDAGLVYVDATTIIDLEYEVDNRQIRAATLDIRIAQVVTDAPPQVGLDETITIEKVSRKAQADVPNPPTDEPVVNLPFKWPP